ncbi:MAG: ATP-binding protein [Chitinophagales bacterium]|nr:ATP-binding protein [Chitinophagales bacterium]
MVFTGPESSGKTAGAEWLSTYYQIALVPEIAQVISE